MAVTDAFTLTTDAFSNIHLFGQSWIVPAILVMLTLVMISRDVDDWKEWGVVVATVWTALNVRVGIIIWVLLMVIAVVNVMSVKIFSNLLTAGKEVQKAGEEIKRVRKEKPVRKTIKGGIDRILFGKQ